MFSILNKLLASLILSKCFKLQLVSFPDLLYVSCRYRDFMKDCPSGELKQEVSIRRLPNCKLAICEIHGKKTLKDRKLRSFL